MANVDAPDLQLGVARLGLLLFHHYFHLVSAEASVLNILKCIFAYHFSFRRRLNSIGLKIQNQTF